MLPVTLSTHPQGEASWAHRHAAACAPRGPWRKPTSPAPRSQSSERNKWLCKPPVCGVLQPRPTSTLALGHGEGVTAEGFLSLLELQSPFSYHLPVVFMKQPRDVVQLLLHTLSQFPVALSRAPPPAGCRWEPEHPFFCIAVQLFIIKRIFWDM